MNLKTSLFNKSIFKTDMKRYWWIGVLETLILIITCAIPVYEAVIHSYSYRSNYPSWTDGSFLIPLLFSAGVSLLLYSYLHSNASVSGYHSLPVKRTTIFTTKLISGAVLTLVPIAICGIILGSFLTNANFKEYYGIADILSWTITGFLYIAVYFSLTTIVNQLTGNTVAALVFTCGFTALPALFISFFDSFFYNELYGYVHYSGDIIDYIYASEHTLKTIPGVCVYVAFAVVFILGALMLYKHRKLECHGEVIAFKWLEPVFIGIVAIFGSILSYTYFSDVLSFDSVWLLIPFGLLGTVISWMISRKSLNPKGILKPILIYLAGVVCFSSIIEFDLTGFETRIPDISMIESAQITYDNSEKIIYVNGRDYICTQKGKLSPEFTDEKDIKNVLAFHKYSTENRKADITAAKPIPYDYNYDITTIPVTYTLKNGKTLKREYKVLFEDDAHILAPLYETPQLRASLYPISDGSVREYTQIEITDRRIESPVILYPDNEWFNKITDALIKDINSLSYESMTLNPGGSVTLAVHYRNKYETEDYIPPENIANFENDMSHYTINSDYKNTMAVLSEAGILDSLPQAKDLEGATITTWTGENLYLSEKDIEFKKEHEISTTDYEQIEKLYNEYENMLRGKKWTDEQSKMNVEITFRIRGKGKTFMVSASYDKDKLPELFEKYFD